MRIANSQCIASQLHLSSQYRAETDDQWFNSLEMLQFIFITNLLYI